MKKTLLALSLLSISFVNAQLENGMVAHFPFNGNLNDVSNSAIVSTNTGGSTFGMDRNSTSNNAVVLGNGKYISFNNNAIKTQFPITISVWVKFNSFPENSNVFSSDNVTQNYHGYWMNVLASGKVALNFGAGLGTSGADNRRTFLANQQLTVGKWHHIVAIIRSHDDMSIYMDCRNSPGSYSGTGSTSIEYSTTNSRIGNGALQTIVPQGWFVDGSIDQLAIWNRDLSSEEVLSLCQLNSTLSVIEIQKASRELVKIINVLGQEVKATPNTPLIYIYSDGSIEKVVIVE
ncbi:MAG: LamG domain-containing protein [Crocinitomicaceae bacterium]|nr:LamG domain-containing protein [Crocinitomicaceae bacterium]